MEDIVFALEGTVVAIIIATCCYLPLADWGLENPTSSQFGTAEWLTTNGINQPTAIMERPRDEHRSSFDFKREWVDENAHQIALWVDDHVKMCDYVESLGIPVVRVSPRLTGDNNGIH